MTEREMLELAAKAAGIEIEWCSEHPFGGAYLRKVIPIPEEPYSKWVFWNPLTDDGDALRLAVKLRISVMLAETAPGAPECAYAENLEGGPVWRYVPGEGADLLSATRRAIVHAAAAIGRVMP